MSFVGLGAGLLERIRGGSAHHHRRGHRNARAHDPHGLIGTQLVAVAGVYCLGLRGRGMGCGVCERVVYSTHGDDGSYVQGSRGERGNGGAFHQSLGSVILVGNYSIKEKCVWPTNEKSQPSAGSSYGKLRERSSHCLCSPFFCRHRLPGVSPILSCSRCKTTFKRKQNEWAAWQPCQRSYAHRR